MILILMVEGARAVISFCMRSAIPGYMVVPPDMTVLAYRSFLMSTSHFMMEFRWSRGCRRPPFPGSWAGRGPGAPEPLVADGDDLAVGQLVGLLQGGGSGGGGHLLLEVQGNVAELLLDVTDNLPLGSGGEGVAPLGEDLHQVVGELTASQVETDDGVGESVTLVDGDTVGDTVAGIHNNTSLSAV